MGEQWTGIQGGGGDIAHEGASATFGKDIVYTEAGKVRLHAPCLYSRILCTREAC
jgi:hypothetical protein